MEDKKEAVMERTIKKYGNITLINIVSDEPMEWDISGATHEISIFFRLTDTLSIRSTN